MEVLSDGGGEGSRLASYTKEIISGKSKQTVVSKLKKNAFVLRRAAPSTHASGFLRTR